MRFLEGVGFNPREVRLRHQSDRSQLDFINVHEQCKINYFNLFTMLATMISMFMGTVQQSSPFMDKLNRPMHIFMVVTNIIRSTNGSQYFTNRNTSVMKCTRHYLWP